MPNTNIPCKKHEEQFNELCECNDCEIYPPEDVKENIISSTWATETMCNYMRILFTQFKKARKN